jgi:hypothetical protein
MREAVDYADLADKVDELEARVEALENDLDDDSDQPDPHAHLPGEWRDPDDQPDENGGH